MYGKLKRLFDRDGIENQTIEAERMFSGLDSLKLTRKKKKKETF